MAKQSENKRQHYIPRSYLSAWCDSETPPNQTPYVWVFDRDSRSGKKKSPNNIFYEIDTYTIKDQDGGRNIELEKLLSRIEGQFETIRKEKLSPGLSLTPDEHWLVLAFIAVMRSRTPSERSHIKQQWGHALRVMDDLSEKMKTMTESELKGMAEISKHAIGLSDDEGLSHKDVAGLVSTPLQTTLSSSINVLVPMLEKLNFAVFETDSEQGFITCDDPCVWFDPEIFNLPPILQSPALGSPTIEVIFPISPRQCIWLSRGELASYCNLEAEGVAILNQRIRANAREHFVSNKNTTHDKWFE